MGMFYQDRWNPVNLVLGRSKFWLKPHLRSSRSHCQSYWISSHFFFLLKNTTRCNHQEQRTNTADWQKERLGHSLDGRKEKKKKKAFSEWEQVVIVTMTTVEIMTEMIILSKSASPTFAHLQIPTTANPKKQTWLSLLFTKNEMRSATCANYTIL